ncbi:MAG TPA: hypothetical protein VHE59_03235 [Mucilaginibacter sp.]|nr:hypothetical protein [Mucilaginibacter sp.]
MAKRPITSEKAVELLKKHGTIATIDESRKILDFMNKMATINIEMLLNENKRKKG